MNRHLDMIGIQDALTGGNTDAAHSVVSQETGYVKALKALRMRLEKRPAWYQWNLPHDTKWWVTPFTYEQMESNRENCLKLIDRALAASPVSSRSPQSTEVALHLTTSELQLARDGLKDSDRLDKLDRHKEQFAAMLLAYPNKSARELIDLVKE